MHSDQEVLTDELIQLEVVDVSVLADLGGVDHHEEVVDVHVDPGHVVALAAVADRHRVEAELLGEQPLGLGRPGPMSSQQKPSVR